MTDSIKQYFALGVDPKALEEDTDGLLKKNFQTFEISFRFEEKRSRVSKALAYYFPFACSCFLIIISAIASVDNSDDQASSNGSDSTESSTQRHFINYIQAILSTLISVTLFVSQSIARTADRKLRNLVRVGIQNGYFHFANNDPKEVFSLLSIADNSFSPRKNQVQPLRTTKRGRLPTRSPLTVGHIEIAEDDRRSVLLNTSN